MLAMRVYGPRWSGWRLTQWLLFYLAMVLMDVAVIVTVVATM